MRPSRFLGVLLLALALASPALAVPGAADRVPAATLLVPFFETGINVNTHPHDTLLVVTNWLFADVTFHYHVWDVDGNATGLSGNILLDDLDSWSAAMRDLLNASSPSVRTQLTRGAYYRGFITIDVVTAATALNPRQAGYPFGTTNALEGFTYYTRLSQGSANGLAMVPLEHLPGTTDSFMRGFSSGGDNREEIDSTARFCANQLAVVNVIENSQLVGTQAGWISVFDVPNVQVDSHVYAFSFNSAAPAGNPNLTWDALFEGYIIP